MMLIVNIVNSACTGSVTTYCVTAYYLMYQFILKSITIQFYMKSKNELNESKWEGSKLFSVNNEFLFNQAQTNKKKSGCLFLTST